MDNINVTELLEKFSSEINLKITDTVKEALADILDDSIEDLRETIEETVQENMPLEHMPNVLHILSQDKTLFTPIVYAKIEKSPANDPKSLDYPYVIMGRVYNITYNVLGWYKDEKSAKEEIMNIIEAVKYAVKSEYTVYEMH